MINGATGVRAAVLAPYVKQYGIGLLFYIVITISLFQFIAGVLKLAKFVRMVPRPVMIGFVNGLAIILAMGQIFQFQIPCYPPRTSMERPIPSLCQVVPNGTAPAAGSFAMVEGAELWLMFLHIALVFATIKLIPLIPKAGKYIPASLTGLLLSILLEWAIIRPSGARTPVIGEVGMVRGGLPIPFFADPQYSDIEFPQLTWSTFRLCLQPAFIASAAGAVEAVMTMEVVNDLTDSGNEAPNQQLIALSIGNAISGLFGTMGGGATIGLSVINCESGADGRFRLSGVVAGIFVLLFILIASPLIEILPTASLVGVMVVVVLSTFDWESLLIIMASALPKQAREWLHNEKYISFKRKIRRVDAAIIILVTVVTLVQDLFIAVAAGVLLAAFSFSWEVGERLSLDSETICNKAGEPVKKIYTVRGPLFFASAQRFASCFDAKNDPDFVIARFEDTAHEHISDYSGFHALNVVGEKYRKYNKEFVIEGYNDRSSKMISKTDKLRRSFSLGTKDENASNDGDEDAGSDVEQNAETDATEPDPEKEESKDNEESTASACEEPVTESGEGTGAEGASEESRKEQ